MNLLDECREKLRLFRYALRTERNHSVWIERTIRFCKTPRGRVAVTDLHTVLMAGPMTHRIQGPATPAAAGGAG